MLYMLIDFFSMSFSPIKSEYNAYIYLCVQKKLRPLQNIYVDFGNLLLFQKTKRLLLDHLLVYHHLGHCLSW